MTSNQKSILFFVSISITICAIFYVMHYVYDIPAYPEKSEVDIYADAESDKESEFYNEEPKDSEFTETTDFTEADDTASNVALNENMPEVVNTEDISQSFEEMEVSTSEQSTDIEEFSTDLPNENLGNEEYFKILVSSYKDELKEKVLPNKNRTDIIIRYYHHEQDGDKALALKELGLYLHERPVEEVFSQYPSNTLFYGDLVSVRDLQLIAYSLVSNGINISSIQMSKYHDSWKSKAVEIGCDTTLLDSPAMTLTQIRDFSK